MTDQEDDIIQGYAQTAQIRQELNSSAIRLLRDFGEGDERKEPVGEKQRTPGQEKYYQDQLKRGRQPEEIEKDMATQGQATEPAIDPVSAFLGGAGAPFKIGISQSARLMPTLVRALGSGTSGAAMEYPIGMATEKIEETFPRLALPFSVIVGIVSGASIDVAIEKAIVAASGKAGVKLAPDVVKEVRVGVMARIQNPDPGSVSVSLPTTGAGKIESEAAASVIRDLNETVENTQLPMKHVLGDPNKPLVGVSKEKVDKLLEKTTTFLDQDVADLPTDKAININFARIESGDDIKEVLARTAEVFKDEIQAARRGVQSNEQTQKLANLIGLSPEQLLARRSGQAFNAEESLAARRILVSSGERLSTLSKIIAGRVPLAETEFADATMPEIQAAFQKQLLVHAGIQEQVSGMTAEAGRALQSYRIMAKSTEGKLKAVDELMRNLDKGKMSTQDLAAKIAGIDSGEGLNTYVRQLRQATSWDMVMEAWINGMLSGPVTHSANMLSNGLVALLQVPERAIAAGISKLSGSDEIKLAEAGYQAFGMIEGFKNGLTLFCKAMRTGEASDQFSKVDLPMRRAISAKNFGLEDTGIAARAVDLLGEGVRIPGRLLSAEDEFFKSIGYRMELNARAYRQAAQEGLSGDALAKRIREIIADPPDDISSAAIDAARYQTFTNALGDAGNMSLRIVAKYPALRLIAPFIQTPVNILKFAGERTPLAIASRAIREEIAAGGARRDLALARISMGSMVMATAATAAGAGMITGGGPSDPELKAALRRTGWQPYSIKLGDKYYAYNRLEPLGMLFGIAADASEIMGQASDKGMSDDIAAAAVIAISKNVTSKTWLKGFAEAVEALDAPDRSAKKFLMNYARSFVPAGVAQVEKQLDPVERETWDRSFFGEVANSIKARIPGWSSDLPPKRNLWGEAITWEGALGPDILSPIYISTAKHSPIDDEMVRLKMRVAVPEKEQSFEGEGIDLTPKEFDRFVQLVNTIELSTGMPLKKSLDHLVTRDPDYKDAPDERQDLMIRALIIEARGRAKIAMLGEFPELRRLVDDRHVKKQAQAGARRQQPMETTSAPGSMPSMYRAR
jgi:hypothetical protein